MRDIVKPTVILFVVCMVVTIALAVTNAATKDKIIERAEQDENNSRKEVLSEAESFEEVQGLDTIIGDNAKLTMVKKAFKGVKDGQEAGKVFMVESKGYGGVMKITIGIDASGKVSGVKITEMNETPGLGSKASESPFMSQFNVAPKEPFAVVKSGKSKNEEISAISGATITSKAVTQGVQAAVDADKLMREGGGL